MKKKRLSFIMAHSKLEDLEKITDEIIEKYEVKATKEPEKGLTMVKVRDGVYRENFYIGEILITECTVHLNGKLGLGISQGDTPKRAYYMAVIDAAFNARVAEKEEFKEKLFIWEKEIELKRINDKAMVEGSKVKVQTMGG